MLTLRGIDVMIAVIAIAAALYKAMTDIFGTKSP